MTRSWPRTTMLLLALVLPAGAGCTSSASRTAPHAVPGGRTETRPVLAYVRPGELRVADATGHSRRLAALEAAPSVIRWSPDGTSLAWLDNSAADFADSTRLHLVRVGDGKVTTLPCPCAGLGFLGNTAATLLADGTALELLASDGAPRRLPLDRRQPSYSRLAAGGGDHVTIAAALDERKTGVRGQSALRTVDSRGHVRPVPGASQTASTSGLAAPDGRRIAFDDSPSGGACASREDMAIVDPAQNQVIKPKPPRDPAFRSAVLSDKRLISSYSWAGPGVVMTFVPLIGCQVAYPSRLVSYYRDGDRWSLLGTGWLAVGYGRDGRWARIEPPPGWHPGQSNPKSSDPGRLVLSRAPGAESVLGTDVTQFAFTPQEAAAARPVPARLMATPPPITTDNTGSPLQSDPRYPLYLKVKDAVDRRDIARLHALCGHCTARQQTRLDTPSTVRRLARLLQTHPILKMGDLIFPSLAHTPCIDMPAASSPDDTSTDVASCTEQDIHDIGTLGLKEHFDLEHDSPYYTTATHTSFSAENNGPPIWSGPPTS